MNSAVAILRKKHWGETQEQISKVWLRNYGSEH